MKDGGPAFPMIRSEDGDGNSAPIGNALCYIESAGGMTKREIYAGLAMLGMLAANAKGSEEINDKNVDYIIAREAFASADAMLEYQEQEKHGKRA